LRISLYLLFIYPICSDHFDILCFPFGHKLHGTHTIPGDVREQVKGLGGLGPDSGLQAVAQCHVVRQQVVKIIFNPVTRINLGCERQRQK
jgi:hypothetical protein